MDVQKYKVPKQLPVMRLTEKKITNISKSKAIDNQTSVPLGRSLADCRLTSLIRPQPSLRLLWLARKKTCKSKINPSTDLLASIVCTGKTKAFEPLGLLPIDMSVHFSAE